jgi:hypothetical protein
MLAATRAVNERLPVRLAVLLAKRKTVEQQV